MKKLIQNVSAFATMVMLMLFGVIGSAFATVPVAVTDSIAAGQADGESLGWAALGTLIALIIFKYIRRAV